MRLVRLGQQPSRVAEDVRAALASLGRGSTVIGGVALVGARPAGDDRAVEAVVVLPKGVLIVIGVDLPDPALRLEAPLSGPWKADGWPLVHGDDAINPATEALDLSQDCERRIAELAPGSGPVGTIVAVGPYVETVDQPPADLAGPVRVLHPTPTAMLAATVSLATARSPRSLDQARALISALAPDAPALPDDVLVGEGFVRYTDDPPVPVAAPVPARVQKPAVPAPGASTAGPAVKRPAITSVPPPPPVIPTVVPVPHVADTPPESADPPQAAPAAESTSAASPAASDALGDAPTESTAPPPGPGAAPSTSADPQLPDEPDTPLDAAATEKMAAPKQEPVTTPRRVPGPRPAPAATAPKAMPVASRPGASAGPAPAAKPATPVFPAAASAGKAPAPAQNRAPASTAAPVVGTTGAGAAAVDRTSAPVTPGRGAPRPGAAPGGAPRTGAPAGPVGPGATRTSATATAAPRQAVTSAPSSAGSREVAAGAVPQAAEKSSKTVRWVPVAAIGLLAVLLVTAIVVAATGGSGGGEAAPAPSQRASAPAAPPVASSGAPASSAAPSLSFEPRASSADQRCASHAFGDVQASLQQTSCSAVRRASYTALVDGRPAAVTIAVVEFPDAAQATHFKQVADTPGGGGILDVATETGKWSGPPPQFDSAAYASKIDGTGVRLVQVVWQTGPSTPDDPGLTRAAQGALALTMPS
ncbi:hypothetical protein [Amycolatopsis sp. NPDC051903]|uniref:hypothetical protein n=1 Tax=Amycolatopsis sp. NPDC051903 TaxID=3363936 RepID=UPI0037B9684D